MIKPVKGTIINKNCFSPQNEPHTAKLCFPIVLKRFRGNSLKTSLFSQKIKSLRNKLRKIWSLFFLTSWKRRKSRERFGLVLKNPFCTKQLNGTNINKNYFCPQNEPHKSKLCFSVVLKHFGGNLLKSLFLIKQNYLRKEVWNTQKVCFLNKFEKGQILRKIRIYCKQPFLFKAVKLDKYKQKLFFSSKWAT